MYGGSNPEVPLSYPKRQKAVSRTTAGAGFHARFHLIALTSIAIFSGLSGTSAVLANDADLIFKKSTVWKFLTPNDKLAVYGIDDLDVEGVSCHFTVSEKGGIKGTLGLAEQTSDVSLACRQIGPIKFKNKLEQGDVAFRESRSFFFKKMQIVRGCDAKRNVLVYLAYSDKLIDGSPKNSTSSVPIMPWGTSGEVPKCGEFIK